MSFFLSGYFCGQTCDRDELSQPLSGMVLRLYRPNPEADAIEQAGANLKDTFQPLDEQAIEAKAKRLIAEVPLDAKGQYQLELDEGQNDYQGGALEYDLYVPTLPDLGQGDALQPRAFTPFQISLTTFQPRWREDENDRRFFRWQYCLTPSLYCYLLRLMDLWVISGRVLACGEQRQVPLPGVEVRAMDDDWIGDDELGTATTDEQGRFRIWYTSRTFKQTFLSPVINVETPFPPFNTGPDVSFELRRDGGLLVSNDASELRKDVGNCLCVTLCVPEGIIIPDDDEPTAGFVELGTLTRYGIQSDIHPESGKTDRTGEPGRAFFGTVGLMGTLSRKLNDQPMEYRFEVREYAASGGGFAPLTSWSPVLKPDMARTVIGYREEISLNPSLPFIKTDYAIHAQTDEEEVVVDGDGWIAVPQVAGFRPNLNGMLLNLPTNRLMTATADVAGLTQGDSVTTRAALLQNRYFALRMVKREAGTPSSEVMAGTSRPVAICNTTYQNMPKGGSWVPRTADSMAVACLDLVELIGDGCGGTSDSITVRYTAAHPNLGGVTLTMAGPDGPHTFTPASPLPENVPDQEAYGTATYAGNVSVLPDCAYILTLQVTLLLTNGVSGPGPFYDRLAFCKKAALPGS